MDVLKTVRNTVCRHNMLAKKDRVLVGLSGGADSTALLYVLTDLAKEYDLEIAAAHVNHGLRQTADRDMDFCRKLCKNLGIEFFCIKKNISAEAEIAGMSEELYARNVRYDFFESLGFDKIATAHNKNDVAETLLFNFMRGSSINGLSGIPYIRGNIIRPLLDIKKADIFEFCRENGYEFVTDETNLQAVYSRNKIRLDLIPKIEKEFNPSFVDVAVKNAGIIREDSEYLDNVAKKAFSDKITISELNQMEMPIKRRVLQLFWKKATAGWENLSAGYIDDILELSKNRTGKGIDLPKGFSAKVQYGELIIEKKQEKVEFFYKLTPEAVLNINEIGKTVLVRKTDKKPDFYLDKGAELTVRSKRTGDVFYPTNMEGKKRLSDFFTDKKIPMSKRNKTPILLCGDEIVAVGDMRFSRNFQDDSKIGYKIEIKEMQDAN